MKTFQLLRPLETRLSTSEFRVLPVIIRALISRLFARRLLALADEAGLGAQDLTFYAGLFQAFSIGVGVQILIIFTLILCAAFIIITPDQAFFFYTRQGFKNLSPSHGH